MQQLASVAKSALLRISNEIARQLNLKLGPKFRGKDDPEVRVTGFAIKDGRPALAIVASQEPITYYGAPLILPGGKRLRTVTVSAVVVYDPKTGASEINDVQWLRKGDMGPSR